MTPILSIKDLSVKVAEKQIISKLNLTICPGEIHVIMGPNGSGKSTLANVLVRNPDYEIVSGNINFLGKDIIDMSAEECARCGMFLSFQNPIAIPGVSNLQFLKTAVNAVLQSQGKKPLDAADFIKLVKSAMSDLAISEQLLYRAINDDFSGGEKKRNEILQMVLLQPKLAILDEIDSGLDIDALKIVAKGIQKTHNKDNAILLITHYQRILDYIKPDHVHVLSNNTIVHSGDHSLAKELEKKGYSWLQGN